MTASNSAVLPEHPRPDLYQLLDLDPATTDATAIRASYRRAALALHPDKSTSTSSAPPDAFMAAAEAYRILSDAGLRSAYDKWLAAYQASREPHFTVDLDDMVPHYAPGVDEDNDDEDPSSWTHACRCGGEFSVTVEDLDQGVSVVQCSGCTLRCRIVYYTVDENA
ncbi:Diphthamide biosynthesis protein 4 [Allomyces arbusculus]|nr:Diphthamide biosynthesis protein 4 [Allomyces arbusculus]